MFKGSNGDMRVGNATGVKGTVRPGVWQTVACRRTASEIQLLVDGQIRARRAANPGTISTFGKALTIGGKTGCSYQCDYFVGEADWVRISG